MAPISDRIKQARLLNALSMRKLAPMVGVSHNAIAKYERAEDIPSSGVLLRLSRALNVSLDYFFREPSVKLGDPRFRHPKKKLRKMEEQKLLADIREWLERCREVEQIFERDSSDAFVWPKGFPQRVSSVDRAEKLAEDLRRLWDLGSDPIPDMVELLEGKGIRVYQEERDDAFDALVVPVRNGNEFVIVINSSFSGDHQRLSLAHELGHVMLKPSRNSADSEEDVAIRFGAALIVPKQAAIEELGQHRRHLGIEELHSLKHKYGLSMQAWVKRARELGILAESKAERLLDEFRKKGWDKKEPGEQYPVERPRRMERLVHRALAEELITRSAAEEFLGRQISRLPADHVPAGHTDAD